VLAATKLSDAACLADQWASMHRNALFAVHECELHYLSTTALSASDDLVAHLLLKKLKLAKKVSNDSGVRAVRMNSVVEFDEGDNKPRTGRLIHPSAPVPPNHGIGISSLVGAGLIGLTEGQSILWPNHEGIFRPLNIVRIVGAGNDLPINSFKRIES
jgi:regulator of nucleoside diphosphate kinase